MTIESWFSICFSFIGIALSLFTYITKKEKNGAIIAIIISFLIALICFFVGLNKSHQQQNSESLGKQLSNTLTSVQNNESSQSISSTTMFTNYFETHTPNNDSAIVCSLSPWNTTQNKDISGSYHEYEQGLKLHAGRYFYANDYNVTSDIHLIYNKNYNANPNFSGKIVVSDDSSGTKSAADISILIDGVEVWKTEQKITGLTISPIEFNVNTKNCKEEIIIRTNFYLIGDSLTIGIF